MGKSISTFGYDCWINMGVHSMQKETVMVDDAILPGPFRLVHRVVSLAEKLFP